MRAYGRRVAGDLKQSFVDNGFNVRKLMSEIVVVSALKPTAGKPLADAKPVGSGESSRLK